MVEEYLQEDRNIRFIESYTLAQPIVAKLESDGRHLVKHFCFRVMFQVCYEDL